MIDESIFKGKFEYVYLKKHTIKNDVNDWIKIHKGL
jgi:hypothetical protein